MSEIQYELNFNPDLQGPITEDTEQFGYEDKVGMVLTLDREDWEFLGEPESIYVTIRNLVEN